MSNAKYILVGDAVKGLKYTSTAMYFLKLVRQTGLTSINRTFPVPDGRIRVVLDPHAGDKVYIEMYGCPAVTFSGLLDTFKAIKVYPFETPAWLKKKQVVEELRLEQLSTRPAQLMCGVRPVAREDQDTLIDGLSGDAAPVVTQGVDGDFYTQTNTANRQNLYIKQSGEWVLYAQDITKKPSLTTRLPVEATVLETMDKFGDPLESPFASIAASKFRDAVENYKPSRFTGIMRKVVQATLASDAWEGFVETIVEGKVHSPACPVNYKFGDSWGCIKHNNSYFFIQIVLNTVYYVPSEHCVHRRKSATGAAYDVIILRRLDVANKVSLGKFSPYQGASWDAEIGWAFSYDKPEAAIVYKGTREAGGQAVYVATRLLTIEIKFDQETGLPNGIEFDDGLDTEDVMYENYYMNRSSVNGGHAFFNHPSKSSDGEIRNATADFGIQPGERPPIPLSSEAPVYVYYTEKYGRQLWMCRARTSPGSSTTIPTPDNSTQAQGATWGAQTRLGTRHMRFCLAEESLGTLAQGETSNLTTTSPGDPFTELYSSNICVTSSITIFYDSIPLPQTDPPTPVSHLSWPGLGTPPVGSAQKGALDRHNITLARDSSSMYSNLTISGEDKEVALVYESLTTGASSETRTTTRGVWHRTGTNNLIDTEAYAEMLFYLAVLANSGCNTPPGASAYITYTGSSTSISKVAEPYIACAFAAGLDPMGYLNTLVPYFDEIVRCDKYFPPFGKVLDTSTLAYTAPGEVVVTNTPSSTTATHTLYSGSEPIQVVLDSRVTYPEPYEDNKLALSVSQAAFNPENIIRPSGNLSSTLQASIVDSGSASSVKNKYSIGHQLWGWLGVA